MASHHACPTAGVLSELIFLEPFALADIASFALVKSLLLLGNVPVLRARKQE